MTKLEAWKAWGEIAGTADLATEFTLEQSSHGKAFSFAWDAAAKAEREECAKVCDARYMGDNNREDMEAKRCAAAIRSRA